MHTPKPVDLVIDARYIVPIEPAGTLVDHSLVIDDGRIIALALTASIERDYVAQVRDSRAGQRAYARRDGADARNRRRCAAQAVAGRPYLAARRPARLAGIRRRRNASRCRRNAQRRHHVCERHVFLSRCGGARIRSRWNAGADRNAGPRLSNALRIRRGRLSRQGLRCARCVQAFATTCVCSGASRAVYGCR